MMFLAAIVARMAGVYQAPMKNTGLALIAIVAFALPFVAALVLYLLGEGDERTAILGWAYVGLRVLHSLVQATVNKVVLRFALFALSSAVLIALIALAARAAFLGTSA